MVKPEVRERLDDDALVFDNPAYDNSIIGQTFDGSAITMLRRWPKSWQRTMKSPSRKPWISLITMQSDHYHMRERKRP